MQQISRQYGLLKVHGKDAQKFLQGQVTCNIETAEPGTNLFGAHCNPQGRIISLFQLFLHDNAYYLLLPNSMLEITTSALKKYIVFFKAQIDDASESVTSIIPQEPSQYFDIHKGIPSIYPETTGMFLPHEINLPALGAVSFDKGCYTGQEIIARMQYRGKLKKRMQLAALESTIISPPGTPIYRQNDNVSEESGTIVNSCHDQPVQHLLIVTEDAYVKNQFLFVEQPDKQYLRFT